MAGKDNSRGLFCDSYSFSELSEVKENNTTSKKVTDMILSYKDNIGFNDFLEYTGLKKTAGYNLVATLEDRRLGKIV